MLKCQLSWALSSSYNLGASFLLNEQPVKGEEAPVAQWVKR